MLTPIRAVLVFVFVLALLSWWALGRTYRANQIPVPHIQAQLVDPYAAPELSAYQSFFVALEHSDKESLKALAEGKDYLAYQAASALAYDPDLSALERYSYLKRLAALRVPEPIDRDGNRHFALELAHAAEAAGLLDEALGYLPEALPLEAAITSLKRLQPDPYRQANSFLNAALYQEVLLALDGRTAPSLEAPAYRRLNEFSKAIDAYDRWLAEVPGHIEASLGKAWAHYALGEYQTAETLFASVAAKEARYGQALANKSLGNIDQAVSLLEQTGDVEDLWLAAGYLELAKRYSESIELYLKLAKTTSKIADDAAYRAYVLATRLGDAGRQSQALAQLSQDSFFALKLGNPLAVPKEQRIASASPAVLRLAQALARAGNREAAIGELIFALRNSESLEESLSIAEYLQAYGEYRQSQRMVSLLFYGSHAATVKQDYRAWRLVYPRAFEADVLAAAQKYGLEPALLWAIMRQESAFFPRALSRSNAKGLMQVIPSTWDWLAELQKEQPGDPFDIATNIRYGAFYLDWLRRYFAGYDGDQELIIASYNRGQGYIKRLFESEAINGQKDDLYREIDALETREYLQQVSLNYYIYKELYQD